MDMSYISVSKLCCPACWDLHDILSNPDKGKGKDRHLLRVPGRHATVYPVLLPAGLASWVVEKMIKRFEGYLYKEFENMWPTITQGTLDARASFDSFDTVESDTGLNQGRLAREKTTNPRLGKLIPRMTKMPFGF